jgi:tRNA nucleotidyltransferase/poly(A) polymerase
MKLHPPAAVLDIARRLDDAGRQAWAVGGAVRDALLGQSGVDWDIATDARPDEVRRIFRRTVPIGIEHGTVGVLANDDVMYEVTTFRRDVETFGRHATVRFADSIEEDLSRRDFTINAIAWAPLTDELFDPFDGRADLGSGILRTVGNAGERFAEDYLRVLRALRFAGQMHLRIDDDTWTALEVAVDGLDGLSAERVREELLTVLAKQRRASVTLRLYERSGALARLFPELQALVGLSLSAGAGDGGPDLWNRTLAAVDAVPPSRPLLRLAALLHAAGYPPAKTRDLRGGWRFTGHETFGARTAEDVLRRLRCSNAEIAFVTSLVARQSDLFPPDAPDAGVRRWLMHVAPELVRDFFRLRIALWRADPVTGGDRDLVERWRHAHAVLMAKPVLTVGGLAIDGGDLQRLGLPPGPEYGRVLRALLERVVEDPALNDRDLLISLVRQAVG